MSDERPVVVIYHTIMDGTVLRWYHTSAAAMATQHEYMSVSRNGVMAMVFLHNISAADLAAANEVYETLKRDRRADVTRFATHLKPFLGRELEPIVREAAA